MTVTFLLDVNGHKVFECGDHFSLWRLDTGEWVDNLTRAEAVRIAESLPTMPSRPVSDSACPYCLGEDIRCPVCQPD